MSSTADRRYMARALQLAQRGLYTTDPNPRVGCVLVRDGEIVGEGWHVRAGEPHAEINALQDAGERARGAAAYVTLEPCSHHGRTPPCADALIAAGITRVVAAMEDPSLQVAGEGLQRLRAAAIQVQSGVLAEQAAALNPGFISRMRRGRPYVRCKLAMSLDGRTAMASGESKWITGAAARADVHRLRARSSAMLTGIGTVLADNPALTARIDDGPVLQPLRVLLDPYLSTPTTAQLLKEPGLTLIVCSQEEADAAAELRAAGAEVVCLPGRPGTIDLPGLMDLLGQREINEVLVETGAVLSGAVLRAGLIDELIVYLAPHLMGDQARGLFHLPGMETMEERIALEIQDIRAVGKDWRITALVQGKNR
ncbi:MAG: bifunctional diaminohydroxyphosphoribosylaminopyrimidine deaminase/5-amino-6-(5-phosphoribosylamino)uracil reductase RibD [Proteobacteria bacterium]|nr:MAG: bifunctional diaminohydroxyphosphoribosylaminopyrimidine deaminase/5-amino-6-(5-phosphoribosylamino)uracil reductase RibD [Pseudomonadota bacterium]QKK11567.1 MAG: bifunctional diaminohydroxyphosphoribosylaminopyrimidine deaminase/5-amino-6-(5-phosphoribosylamino)uracil reductase RibD [Pseudomonadota bacterium]